MVNSYGKSWVVSTWGQRARNVRNRTTQSFLINLIKMSWLLSTKIQQNLMRKPKESMQLWNLENFNTRTSISRIWLRRFSFRLIEDRMRTEVAPILYMKVRIVGLVNRQRMEPLKSWWNPLWRMPLQVIL